MFIDELCVKMKQVNKKYEFDEEAAHVKLDKLLLEYIDNPEVTKLFHVLDKWYA